MTVDWYAEGVKFGNCNCDYSCPCQFEALPTNRFCQGIEVLRIDQGHFGDVSLNGLAAALLYSWPGAIHEGNGTMQAIIDERADPGQRKALAAILHGEETLEGATHWWVFRAMSGVVHETLFRRIDFHVDVDGRTAKAAIPGFLEAEGTPIRSPVSGKEHRIRIDLPNGIEFELAEIGRGSTKTSAALSLAFDDTYGQFNRFHLSGKGIVRKKPEGSGLTAAIPLLKN
jgi:hypothetical protein